MFMVKISGFFYKKNRLAGGINLRILHQLRCHSRRQFRENCIAECVPAIKIISCTLRYGVFLPCFDHTHICTYDFVSCFFFI